MVGEDVKEAVAVGVLLLFWGGLALITSKIAERKGRPEGLWYVLGLMFFLLALIAVLVVSDKSKGPVAAASKWLRLVLRGDLCGAWLRTDYEFRLALARAWLAAKQSDPVVAPYSLDDAAEALAAVASDHPLWAAFEEAQLREFAEVLPQYNDDEWEAPSGPQPLGPDRKLVVFMYIAEVSKVLLDPTLADERIPVVVRYTGQGWVVAALGAVAERDSVHVRYVVGSKPLQWRLRASLAAAGAGGAFEVADGARLVQPAGPPAQS